MNTTSGIITLH